MTASPEPPDTPAPPFPEGLPDWDTWTAEWDRGARAAHHDATTTQQVTPWEDLVAEGPAYATGYNDHWGRLRNAGLIP